MKSVACKKCGRVAVPHSRGSKYCSRACSLLFQRETSSKTMARTNRQYASERMTRKNPMHREESRERVKTTLRAMGWKPPFRGGNGTGPTAPQLLLASTLGWPMEVAVSVGHSRAIRHLPTCYKIDIANTTLKVAIEVDGFSHACRSRQQQDRKKEAFLRGIGWTVLRFSNADVMERLEECVQTVLSTISKSNATTPTSPMDS